MYDTIEKNTLLSSMKIKSVSGLTCYVNDLDKTATFYTMLGFSIKKRENSMMVAYMNWFFITFVLSSKEEKPEFQSDAHAKEKGEGIYIYLSVDDVDTAYNELLTKGYTPSSEPRDWEWGNREFVIRDPDGYKLVLFKKK